MQAYVVTIARLKAGTAVIIGKCKRVKSDWSPLTRSASSDCIDRGFEEGKVDLDVNP